jgi:hypothetical protein
LHLSDTAESAMAAVSAILFKQGRWKKKKI